jgi:hypothetical protein
MKLNDARRKDCFPLPRIGGSPDTVAGTKWFSALDQKSSYWQVDLRPDKRRRLCYLGVKGYGISVEIAENVPAVPRSPPKAKSGKVPLLQKEVRYLKKLRAIWEWQIPKNKHEIRTQKYWVL